MLMAGDKAVTCLENCFVSKKKPDILGVGLGQGRDRLLWSEARQLPSSF